MIRGTSSALAALSFGALSLAATAEARPASQGWYAEGGAGALAFMPKTNKDAAIGPGLGVRIGYDLFSFLSVGIQLGASSHEATVPAPPDGEWFQLYRGAADARIGGRFDRLALFIEGGLGVGMISSNILMKVQITSPGERYSVLFQAGAGGEYQLENRHYAIGLGVDGIMLPNFKPPGGSPVIALDTRLYLRYTY